MTAPKGEPTPKRPSLARKHTPKTEANRKSPMDDGVRIQYEGETYEVRAGDLSALDVRELRKELGLSFQGLMKALYEDSDMDLIVGLIWLAKRVRGEHIPYAVVANEIGYNELDEIQVAQISTEEKAGDNPEG